MRAFNFYWLFFALSGLLLSGYLAAGQSLPHAAAEPATPLNLLVQEAAKNNPAIAAAEHGWKAAGYVPKQAAALPQTEAIFQQLSVGSPRPFAGYTNSDFAYVGVGASQDFPFPGKRKLRGEISALQADSLREQIEVVRRSILEDLKTEYFQLGYLQQTLNLLQQNNNTLQNIEQIAESRYRVGQGNQQEVLNAQLQHTKILQAIAMHHQEEGQLESQLKQLLGRPQDSRDIVAEPLQLQPLTQSSTELLQAARNNNPSIRSLQKLVRKSDAQLSLAKKDYKPDFNLQYMYQNTDRRFRDYYMLTFGIKLPNRGQAKAAVAQAAEEQEEEKSDVENEIAKQLAAVQQQYILAKTSEEQINLYQQGLIPQSQAAFRAGLSAYQSNREDFESLLSSFTEVLNLQLQYQQQLAEHQSALARLEALTGVKFQ